MTLPRPRYLTADHVVDEMARFGTHRLRRLSWRQWFVLAFVGGAFIAAGALFSILLSAGTPAGGARHLLAGLGFSVGFFFVILSEAALFTEANVVLPAVLLSADDRPSLARIAAFFATMGRTIVGTYVPVFLAVTLFVAAGLQHSPANMGYFGLATPAGLGPGWITALGWSIVPAGLGNMLGGAFLVAVPFWYAFRTNPGSATSPAGAEVDA